MTALRNATPDDELKAAAAGADYGRWPQTDMLLADLLDVARWLKWSKTEDGEKSRNHPKPTPRPGVQRPGTVTAKVINILDYMRDHNGAAPEGWANSGGHAQGAGPSV